MSSLGRQLGACTRLLSLLDLGRQLGACARCPIWVANSGPTQTALCLARHHHTRNTWGLISDHPRFLGEVDPFCPHWAPLDLHSVKSSETWVKFFPLFLGSCCSSNYPSPMAMGAPSSANQFRDSPEGGHERLDLLCILLVITPQICMFLRVHEVCRLCFCLAVFSASGLP